MTSLSPPPHAKGRLPLARLALLIATGGGLGYIPIAPGTAGSLLGLVLGVWLLRGPVALQAAELLAGLLLAVWSATIAERELRVRDPSCVVVDEVVAMAGIVSVAPWSCASPVWLLVAFGLFRAFDIIKPPPLRALARLPDGWGVVADDVGAAIYTVVLLRIIYYPLP
ncbi:MAG: phosphatidylglycerophosphatase A [Candidatus Omnitrophica bacterium]|nr:phosphatidylglycerophosphatase A [Candidatus Omnitrophota bacterium]